jgi:hypothetical protein
MIGEAWKGGASIGSAQLDWGRSRLRVARPSSSSGFQSPARRRRCRPAPSPCGDLQLCCETEQAVHNGQRLVSADAQPDIRHALVLGIQHHMGKAVALLKDPARGAFVAGVHRVRCFAGEVPFLLRGYRRERRRPTARRRGARIDRLVMVAAEIPAVAAPASSAMWMPSQQLKFVPLQIGRRKTACRPM